jgi:hypothetical protein
MNTKYPPSRLKGLLGFNGKLKGKTLEEAFGKTRGQEIRKNMTLASQKTALRLEVKEKQSMAKRGIFGEKTNRWIKDRSKLSKKQIRNDYSYQEWRKLVWIRDEFTCRLKDNDCEGKIISHHILAWRDHPDKRYDINNGITLCHYHHPRKRVDEKRLEPILMELVSVSKAIN